MQKHQALKKNMNKHGAKSELNILYAGKVWELNLYISGSEA